MCRFCDIKHEHHSIEHCKHGDNMCEAGQVVHIETINGFYYIACETNSGEFCESYPITHCPMCGRKMLK